MDFWYRSDDRVIGQRIALGKFEKYETELFLNQLKKDSVVVDVGANIGYYTLLAAGRVKKVYAIEPDKKCFEILKKNVEENNLKNVVLINKAASDKKEKKYLVRDKNNQGNSKISDNNGEIILTETLDNMLKNEQKISLIKVDVQGWEPQVISGAKRTIKKWQPTIFLEYTPGEYKDKKMINFLKNIYKNIWSINDFAEVPWPIYKGIKVLGKSGYADLFLKKEMEQKDYVTMIKKVNYKKWIKGIMGLLCLKSKQSKPVKY
ncbi:MAG: FkbM family methyltransferase [Candidatus Shapirobacteria bacterium]